jgi:hypothetical protein
MNYVNYNDSIMWLNMGNHFIMKLHSYIIIHEVVCVCVYLYSCIDMICRKLKSWSLGWRIGLRPRRNLPTLVSTNEMQSNWSQIPLWPNNRSLHQCEHNRFWGLICVLLVAMIFAAEISPVLLHGGAWGGLFGCVWFE